MAFYQTSPLEPVPHVDSDFRLLFEIHPSPMWIYDPETLRFLIVNEAALTLYGHARADFHTMTVLDIRPDYERARMLQAVHARTDIERAERWAHLKADGEVFQVLTYGREIQFEGRAAILAIVQDRSELAVAHQQVSDARSFLDTIVDSLPIGVFVKDLDHDGRYVIYNEECARVIGARPMDIVGRDDAAVHGEERADDLRRQDQRVFYSEGALTFEDTKRRIDGSVTTRRTVKKMLPAADGSRPRYLLGVSQDISEERAVEAELARLAMRDSLTGLWNRNHFLGEVSRRAENIARDGPFAVLYIDVDHFKHINDSIGHSAGDALLCQAAARFGVLADKQDVVARLGGDEFAMLITLSDGDQRAWQIAEGLLAIMADPFDLDGIREHVGCSIGIALAPGDGDNADVLMRNADLALYSAKDAGRATFRFYESHMRIEAERRHQLTIELRRAIERGEFVLHFQPIVRLASQQLSGFEALVRWRHPERGLIPPGDFIATAEDTGLIIPIGEWVMMEACRTAASWPSDIRVAVNLSVMQFRSTNLLPHLVDCLEKSGLDPSRLEIEVTESVFLSDSSHSLPLLRTLKDLGVRIAIDDFGTGYSSLGYLRAFAFDKIKLDKSFVAGVENDPGDLAIVRAVVGMAAGFRAVALAEGIETREQMLLLRAEGFEEAQGYLFGKPMPAADVDALLGQCAKLEHRLSA
ncbi:MAG: EAL domain-containing protein [Rhizobium sp.]|nr:EAL domain-containing protein [Rhizobium sp.]